MLLAADVDLLSEKEIDQAAWSAHRKEEKRREFARKEDGRAKKGEVGNMGDSRSVGRNKGDSRAMGDRERGI